MFEKELGIKTWNRGFCGKNRKCEVGTRILVMRVGSFRLIQEILEVKLGSFRLKQGSFLLRSARKKQVSESIGWGTQIGRKKLRNLSVGNGRKPSF